MTYTVNFPAQRSGELAEAKPVLAKLVETPAFRDAEAFSPKGRPRVSAYSNGVGSLAFVRVRGFWSSEPRPGDDPVRLTITDPEGRRVHLLLGSSEQSSFRDLFDRADTARRPVEASPDFEFLLRPRYPLGRYSVVAAAKGRRAETTFDVAVPPLPTGPKLFSIYATRGVPVVLSWAGYPPGSSIGLLAYVRRGTSLSDYSWEFFARFAPVPTDEFGSLEIDLPTDDAVPGDYCFVTDGEGREACRFSDETNVVSLR